MNPFLLRLADGSSFLFAMLLVALCAALPPWSSRRLVRGICTVLMLVGMVLAVLSSTPLPPGIYFLWILLVLAILVAHNLPAEVRLSRRAGFTAAALLAVPTLILFCWELSYRIGRSIDVPPGQTIYVIGDSLSAGVNRGERCWPAVLAERSGLRITNLAVGGSRIKDGPDQASRIKSDNALVIVELGGNDLLHGTTDDDFGKQLDALLASLRTRGCRIAMFELPLPPLRGAFGRIQRNLASRYDVTLIPKRCLAATWGGPQSTFDGLHLSQQGHDHLAQLVTQQLRTSQAQAVATNK